jgi:hypothetical protein
MVAMAEGTLPLKRLEARTLCDSVPSQDNSRSWCCTGTRAWGVQLVQPGQCRDARREGPDERIPLQGPARGRPGPTLTSRRLHQGRISTTRRAR